MKKEKRKFTVALAHKVNKDGLPYGIIFDNLSIARNDHKSAENFLHRFHKESNGKFHEYSFVYEVDMHEDALDYIIQNKKITEHLNCSYGVIGYIHEFSVPKIKMAELQKILKEEQLNV